MADSTVNALAERLSTFLQQPGLLQFERAWLNKFLTNRMNLLGQTRRPTLYEMEEKLPHLEAICQMYNHPANAFNTGAARVFGSWHLASLFDLPVTELQSLRSDLTVLNQFLDNCRYFVVQCKPLFRLSLEQTIC